MQGFCNDCEHRKVPRSIKNKFNEKVKPFFFECPMNSKDISGCTVKSIVVEWKVFIKWLRDNNILEEEEDKMLKVVGLHDGTDS